MTVESPLNAPDVEIDVLAPDDVVGPMPDTGWLDCGGLGVLAFLHRGRPGAEVGVLMVAPFGWDNMASYGPRRQWAALLSQSGVPVARFDPPGTADSAGDPEMAGFVDRWADSAAVTARWLRDQSGCRTVVALGFSIGGLIALKAAAEGAPIDHFVLWAGHGRGSDFVRETKAFARMEEARLGAEDRDAAGRGLPEGAMIAGGYLLTAETLEALGSLEVSRLALPNAPARRALLLGRDGRKADQRLLKALTDQGVAVTTAPGTGYQDLVIEPLHSRLAAATVQAVEAFLASAGESAAVAASDGRSLALQERITMPLSDGSSATESTMHIDCDGQTLFGILTEPVGPADPSVGVILIGGTGPRMGPNRMWTEMARRWTDRGVRTLRVDVAGAGDAQAPAPPDVAALYTDEACVRETLCVVDAFRRQVATEKIIVLGLCASAYWAVYTALQAPDVVPVGLNLPFLVWDELETARHETRLYRRKLLQARTLRRVLRGDVDFGKALRRMPEVLNLRRRHRGAALLPSVEPSTVLDLLQQRDRGSWFVFAGAEPLCDDMRRGGTLDLARWPNLHLEFFGPHSDLHTFRPLWVQHRLHAIIDGIVDHERGVAPELTPAS